MIEENNNSSNNNDSDSSLNRKIKIWMRRLWVLTIFGILVAVGVIWYFSKQDLPTLTDLSNPQNKLATEIYDNEGGVLGRYFRENRVNVPFDKLNENLIDALVATEDERFFEHSGIDAYGLTRAIVKLGKNGGASTITQQLARLLYTGKRSQSKLKALTQKVKEWITAVKIEKKYTKKEILAMYLNKFNFNYGAYGIKAASEVYFGKGQEDLNIEEAAVLIGMLKNPSLFNPKKRLERTQIRRDVVMKQMVKNDKLSQVKYDSLRLIPLTMDNFSRRSHDVGSARYFLMELRKTVSSILKEPGHQKADGSEYDIYEDGLRVYTTIDAKMQLLAEAEMTKHMASQQKKFFKVWKDDDPWTHKEEDTTDREIEIREKSLLNRIRESNRYYHLRLKILGKNIGAIHDAFDYSIKDYDVDRILKSEKENGYFSKLIDAGLTSKDRIKVYKKIKNSSEWKAFKIQWKVLEEKAKIAFDKPVSMKVFAYNPAGEMDTVLSPLDSIRYHRMILQVGSLGVDPATGEVKFWIGGVNFKYFQFDHLRSNRQVGSTFKPFVYGTAISLQGMSPCEKVKDVGYTIEPGEGRFYLAKPWTPKNADGKYTGEMLTLKEALRQSKNTVSVFLMKQLGDSQPVRELAKNMGIDVDTKRSDGERRVPVQPSICLGAADLNVLEMTGAYTTFANNGTYNKPRFIKKIVDKNGRVLYESIPEERRAMNPKYNYVMVQMLRNVVAGAYGFGKIKSDVGGKTGTTNNYTDGWFIGMTPSLVIGTWVGGEDPWIRFRSLVNGQGGRMARPFFSNYIQALEKDTTINYNFKKRFQIPKGEQLVETDCNTYYESRSELDDAYDHNNDQPGFEDDWEKDSTNIIPDGDIGDDVDF